MFALDEPFVIGNFPITRELDRFYENHEVRIREETELACKTLCAPSDTCGADGFLRKDLAHSIVCKAYRLDVQAISVGCLETTPGLPTKYHALNVRASGGTVQSFDLEAYFLADAPWPNALAEAMNRHASRKQQPLDFLALMNRTHPASKSPLFQHATFTPEAIVLTLMEGAVSGAKAGESVTVPFEELRAVLR